MNNGISELPDDIDPELLRKAKASAVSVMGMSEVAKEAYMEGLKEENPELHKLVCEQLKHIKDVATTPKPKLEPDAEAIQYRQRITDQMRELLVKYDIKDGHVLKNGISMPMTSVKNLVVAAEAGVISGGGNLLLDAATQAVTREVLTTRVKQIYTVLIVSKRLLDELANETPFTLYDEHGTVRFKGFTEEQNNARTAKRALLAAFDEAVELFSRKNDFSKVEELFGKFPELLKYPTTANGDT